MESTTSEIRTLPRIYYLDNLRAIAMLLGIFFHAGLAYSEQLQHVWFTARPESSQVIDVLMWFFHLFRMPVFFVISGYFSILLIRKWQARTFLKKRTLRLMVPFVIFFPVMIAGLFGAIFFGLQHADHLPPIMQFIADSIDAQQQSSQDIKTGHLWFLLYLWWFNLLFVFAYWLRRTVGWFQGDRWYAICLALLPFTLFSGFLFVSTPHPAPEFLFPELWGFLLYGSFFVFGILMVKFEKVLFVAKQHLLKLVFLGAIAYAILYWLMPAPLTLEEAMATYGKVINFTYIEMLLSVLECIVAIIFTLISLVLAKQYLDFRSRFMRLLADASYWIYLIHLPLVVGLQFVTGNWHIPAEISWLLESFVTISIGMLTYLILVRPTPIGWLLNGRKRAT